jgi:hypothetical protein
LIVFLFFSDVGSDNEAAVEEVKPAPKSKKDRKKKKEQVRKKLQKEYLKIFKEEKYLGSREKLIYKFSSKKLKRRKNKDGKYKN